MAAVPGHDTRQGCAHCGAVVDVLRDPVRIVGGRLRNICGACVDQGDSPSADASRARHGHGMAEHEPNADVTADDNADVTADASADDNADATADANAEPTNTDAEPVAGEREAKRPRKWRLYAVALGVIVVLAVVAARAGSGSPSPAAVSGAFVPSASHTLVDDSLGPDDNDNKNNGSDRDDDLAMTEHGGETNGETHGETNGETNGETDGAIDDEGIVELTPESLPPTLEDMWEDNGEPIESRLPTLLDWVFPVLDSDETFPLRASRRFGAKREGKRVAKCGRGHCGVDLKGTRGTPVMAVAWGEVTRIERGTKKRSGRYVRIEHPDYVYTSYMHLDTISDDLHIGDEVDPGTIVGTLGRTGVKESVPHLHFSLEVPLEGKLEHVDPVPFLERASMIADPSEAFGEALPDE